MKLIARLTLAALTMPLLMAQQAELPLTAEIQGYVLDDRTGLPVAGAQLAVERMGRRMSFETRTDGLGYFLVGVPEGVYRLDADRSGYVPATYGSRNGRPNFLRVSPGRRVEIAMRLSPSSTIEGRVYDEDGLPLADARIEVLTLGYGGFGKHRLLRATAMRQRLEPVQSDENGDYRITNVGEGTYYVRAIPAAPPESGALVDGMSPAYYPGFLNPDLAAPVQIPEGTEVRAIDFSIPRRSPRRIFGRVVNGVELSGEGDTAYKFYLVSKNVSISASSLNVPDHDPDPEAFELRNIAPGSYDLYVSWGYRRIPDNPFLYVGRTSLDVTDEDITDLSVAIDPGVEVLGRIDLLGSAGDMARDLGRNISLLLVHADGMPGPLSPTALLARQGFIEPDGTFRLPYVFPGRYFLVPSIPESLYASTVRFGTRDILGRPFEIGPDGGGLILEINGPGGQAEGRVVDRNDAPVMDAQIVLVPGIGLREDFVSYKTATSDAMGRYQVSGIRPGPYTAFAFSDIDRNAWMDPQFMGPYVGRGVSIDVGEHGPVEQILRLINVR